MARSDREQGEPLRRHGPGTVVASIALGDGVGPGPIAARMKGVAPDAALAAVKVLDSTGTGTIPSRCRASSGARAGEGRRDLAEPRLGRTVGRRGRVVEGRRRSHGRGQIVVAAAGNSGDGPRTITSPGSAVTAITVGAVAEWSAQSGAQYRSEGPYLAAFSSRGPTIDDRIKPDVVAPGVTVGAAKAGSISTYVVGSGTSMATPFVAGTAALLRQLQPGWTQSQVRSAIEGTAFDAGLSGKDNDWGAGLLDAYGAVAQAAGATGSTPFPLHRRITGSVADNDSWSTTFELTADDLGMPIAATITTQGTVICVIDWDDFGCLRYGFSPDLDASLSGSFDLTSSTCPAGDECRPVGRRRCISPRRRPAPTR